MRLNSGAWPAVPGGTFRARTVPAVPVLRWGWKDSPRPSMAPGPLGREIVLGPTPLLSAARALCPHKNADQTRSIQTRASAEGEGASMRVRPSVSVASDLPVPGAALRKPPREGMGRGVVSLPFRLLMAA